MTAAHVGSLPAVGYPGDVWTPDAARQRAAAYTFEDLLKLPEHAPRKIELLDGVMIVSPSPSMRHQTIGRRLCNWLEDNAPGEDFEATTDVGVMIDARTALEPDVVLLRAPAIQEHHLFAPDEVVLVVEIVSPGTVRRDRFAKPSLYAAAGVPHFWRIEQDPLQIFAYGLTPGGRYSLVGDSASGLLELSRPFAIALSLDAIKR